MNITHLHPAYKARRAEQGFGKYNGAYYYSRDIVKYFIPNVKTNRNWVTVRLENVPVPAHSIVFIHNNRNPNLYNYLKNTEDLVLVCSTPNTYENMKFISVKVILLPLSVDVKNVEKYKLKNKDRDMAFAGRRLKLNNRVPSECDILTDMSQSNLIKEMAHYKKVYAVGRTAVQAKVLGCEIGMYDNMYPDPKFWRVLDCRDAAKMLEEILNVNHWGI